MRNYFSWVSDQCQGLNTVAVTQQWSGRTRGGCSYTEACNTMFQGMAADAAKITLWDLYLAARDPASPLFGSHQVLFVHDENVTECEINAADAVLAEQERVMIAGVAQVCPDVPITVSSYISPFYRK